MYPSISLLQRRAGLKEGGFGAHVDLPLAWTELSQLAQCRGKIQEGMPSSTVKPLN